MPLRAIRPQWIAEGKAAICRSILIDLPAWFARPEAVDEYARLAEGAPMLGVFDGGEAVGFASLRNASPAAAEIRVMGVRAQARRRGVGRSLVDAVGRAALAEGRSFVSVKTIGPSSPDPHYAETRAFYEAVGFVPIDEFADYWAPGLPMLLMIKPLS